LPGTLVVIPAAICRWFCIGLIISLWDMPNPPLEYMLNPDGELTWLGVDNPGGADSPGGGPVAVENPGGETTLPPNPGSGVEGVMAEGGPMLVDWPVRTPKGFLEKLSRMPPLTLLCKGCP
jgi:hypothetical protein